jgi:hypothetical protein
MDMNGGLMKTTSLYAIAAAAGLVLGMGSSLAADLGGNCCADLEERVAELEATTARKGNRKVNLTISGQVNRILLFWDDGKRDNVYTGVDNTNTSTRVNFTGDAKILPGYKAGFAITLDIRTGGRSEFVNQTQFANVGGLNSSPTTDQQVRLRQGNWWIESERLGRFTVGRLTEQGPVDLIDLANIANQSSANPGCIGGGFFFRNDNGTGTLSNLTLDRLTDHCGDYNYRTNGIQYTSPTYSGFVFSATLGDSFGVENHDAIDGDVQVGQMWAVQLKYANEFNGFQFAAGVGYEHVTDDQFGGTNQANTVGVPGSFLDARNFGASAAVKHVPTGLFIQGDYVWSEREYVIPGTNSFTPDVTMWHWNLQAGIARNFFGIGATDLYAEGGVQDGWGQDQPVFNGSSIKSPASTSLTGGSSVTFWGIGATQVIDAAAMEIYAGFRQYSADATCSPLNPFATNGPAEIPTINGVAGTDCVGGAKIKLQDLDIGVFGARIKF